MIGDQSIPSGVAPYSINYSLTEHSENRSIYDISFNVKNADGGELPLNNAANRVNVVISDPAKATYTPIDEYSGTIKLLSDEEVQIDFIYQRQKADGSYEDVYNGYNDADNPGTIVALNLIFNSADVSRLEKLIAQIETELAGLNLDEYTEESVSALLAALEAAKELVSNPALAVNDQDAVDDAYLALAVAKGALAVKGETPSPDPSSPPTSAPDTSAPTSQVSSDPEKGPATGIPNTGDFTPLSVLIILFSAALCAVPVLLVKSAKKKPE